MGDGEGLLSPLDVLPHHILMRNDLSYLNIIVHCQIAHCFCILVAYSGVFR